MTILTEYCDLHHNVIREGRYLATAELPGQKEQLGLENYTFSNAMCGNQEGQSLRGA